MHPAFVQASGTLAVAAVLSAYVATRRGAFPERRLLLGLLLGLAVWSAGSLVALSAPTPGGVAAGIAVGFAGVSVLAPLWWLLAAQQARLPIVVRHLRAAAVLALLPSALAVLALLTNPAHRLFLRGDLVMDATPRAIVEASGPLFWAFAAWSQLCGFGGALLLLASARRMRSLRRRRPALLLSAAAMLPLLASALFLGDLLPTAQDPTPATLAFSLTLVTVAIFRFGLLDGTLPIARRDVIEHLPDGLLVADAEGVVLDSNPAASHLLGRSDLAGRTLLEALLSGAWDADAARLDEALACVESDPEPRVTVLHAADGRWIEMRTRVVRGKNGESTGQYVLLHDRTDQRRYERFVHQSQKLETVGGMVAGIAHEVNNPLAYVRSNLHVLRRLAGVVGRRLEAFAPEEREDLDEMLAITEETLDGVERIGRIVDGLRRFSRADGDEALPVDLNAVARHAIRLAELHSNREVIVTARLAEALPLVKGSSDRLGQVILNLLMNAKHALAGRPFGRISVETVAQRGGVELHVSDNGPGIPEEIQERVFDPFFTTKGPDEGTGLGLSIAFDIVREHGGSIEISSRPGEGARFAVRLPAA